MPTDPTQYPYAREATQPVYANPYDDVNVYYSSLPPLPPPPPPPSPRQRTPNVLIVVLVGIICLLLLFSIGTLSLLLSQHSSAITSTTVASIGTVVPTPTRVVPTPTPTMNLNYTAVDLMADLNMAGIHPTFVEYDKTIWSWSQDTYFVSVHATSAVDFTDDSSCTGYCSPLAIGIWVYNNANVAQQAFMDVGNDEAQKGSIPMLGMPPEYTHGRCLLLGPASSSIYVQVIMQDCI